VSLQSTNMPCPACDSWGTESIVRFDGIPVHSTVLLDNAESALTYPRRDLELALCRGCGLIFNHLFDPSDIDFSPAFEESQHFSQTFTEFARSLANEIADRCHLSSSSRILEIGCGKGEFLAELCRIANCEGIGLDPAFRRDRLGDDRPSRMSFVADWFGPAHFHLVGDLILCRHTLEHIGPVRAFLDSIRCMIMDRKPVWVVFETPSIHRILKEAAFWDVYYEHVSYFTPGSHARLFRRCGFDVVEVRLVYSDQYIMQYASPGTGAVKPPLEIERDLDRIIDLARSFGARARKSIRHWNELLVSAFDRGKQVAIWGGSSKTVAFLTALGESAHDARIVDKNPFKQGRYLPGSAHVVLAPSALVEVEPDIIIAMNPIYLQEIRDDLAALGLRPSLMAVGT
jgi:SAM-dependent methyltransferase